MFFALAQYRLHELQRRLEVNRISWFPDRDGRIRTPGPRAIDER
jgi:hypothetical protein